MIFSHRLEPDHHLEEYIRFDGDDADFIRICPIDELFCTECGECLPEAEEDIYD